MSHARLFQKMLFFILTSSCLLLSAGFTFPAQETNPLWVTAEGYQHFLTHFASDDIHHFYDEKMSSEGLERDILRLGVPGAYFYVLVGSKSNMPMAYMNLFSAKIYNNYVEDSLLDDHSNEEREHLIYEMNKEEIPSRDTPRISYFMTNQVNEGFLEQIDPVLSCNRIHVQRISSSQPNEFVVKSTERAPKDGDWSAGRDMVLLLAIVAGNGYYYQHFYQRTTPGLEQDLGYIRTPLGSITENSDSNEGSEVDTSVRGLSIPIIERDKLRKENAQQLLRKLCDFHGPGMLRLRYHWYFGPQEFQHETNRETSKEEKQQTAQYIHSIVEAAYPTNDIFHRAKDLLISRLDQHLLNLLEKRENIGPYFQGYLDEHLSQYNKEIRSCEEGCKALQEGRIEKIQDVNACFQKRNITIQRNQPLGAGSFGQVYLAKTGDQECVYKALKQPRNLLENSELNGKWWRYGECAAARFKDLPNVAKSLAFIIHLTSSTMQDIDGSTWYVPADQTKNFGKTLPPDVKVILISHFMERAPGIELTKLLNDQNFKGEEHFYPIANSLFRFLEKSYERNLIHHDIKSENFIYDPITKKGKLIDMDSGLLLGKRDKIQPGFNLTKSHNPLFSTRLCGTPTHMAPVIRRQKPHRSEVDFYSSSIMLTHLLDPTSFLSITSIAMNQQSHCDGTNKWYERWLEQNSESQLATILQENPNMKKTIDLFLKIGNPSSTYPRMKRLPIPQDYFQELRDHMNNVVSKELTP